MVLRKPKMLAVLNAYTIPLWQLYGQWYDYYFQIDYKIKINSQTCYLKKALNDAFDVVDRRIIIEEGQYYNRLYIFQDSENKPKYLPIVLQDESKYGDSGYDFLVNLKGVVLSVDENLKMKALINENKLVGKRYKIINN